MKKAFVTGSEGFIGKHLCARLEAQGVELVRFDLKFGDDLSHVDRMRIGMTGCDVVFHLAANASVRSGWDWPNRDITINTVGTAKVLEAMHNACVTKLVFLSSSAVYGTGNGTPIKERDPLLQQTSLYGASKVAAEAFIQAYCASAGITAHVFRPVPLLGENYHYGHVVDFVKKLKASPDITALGTGRERKTYLYAEDLISAMLKVIEVNPPGYEVYNVAGDESCTIAESIEMIADIMGLSPNVTYTGSTWAGDNPHLQLDTSKIRALGWKPEVGLVEAYKRTVKWLL